MADRMERLAEEHPSANNPYEPYCGVAALFNADLHAGLPDYAPRDDWAVVSPYHILHEPHEDTR